ncbi:hypothetical protein C1646_677352 [Rhizophagus diaphanus]|nr:hypothetical protein C1646_677352 [Rhizophagus diaphanus] [Rhizophagus sp. MUCL 43196]
MIFWHFQLRILKIETYLIFPFFFFVGLSLRNWKIKVYGFLSRQNNGLQFSGKQNGKSFGMYSLALENGEMERPSTCSTLDLRYCSFRSFELTRNLNWLRSGFWNMDQIISVWNTRDILHICYRTPDITCSLFSLN